MDILSIKLSHFHFLSADFKMILSIIFLTIAFTSSLGSTQSQQGTQPESTCNACCQGVAGIPGIPGPSGHNGLPGRDGLSGEKGESGTSIKGNKGDIGVGLPGPEGPRGQKGDRSLSVGLPGKTGPKGSIGPIGRPGGQGLTGLKGEKGEAAHTRRSAFTAVKTNDQIGNTNDVVTFQETTVNINDHFSLSSNKFTCQIPGIYVFIFSIGVWKPTDPFIFLVKNNDLVVTGHTRTIGSDDFDQTGNSALLNLATGDQVWLKFGGHSGRKLHSHHYKYSSFSGFLLYEM